MTAFAFLNRNSLVKYDIIACSEVGVGEMSFMKGQNCLPIKDSCSVAGKTDKTQRDK